VVEEAMRRRGKYWQARPKAGEKIGQWRSTRCTDYKAAQAVLAEWERELADPAYAAAKGITLAQAIDRVNRDYAALVKVGKRSQATADYYLEKTGVLLSVLGTQAVLGEAARSTTVDAFISTRRKESVTEATIKKELGALGVVLKTAKRNGWWSGDVDAVLPHNFSSGSKPRERVIENLYELGRILRVVRSEDVAAQIAFAVSVGAESQAIPRAGRQDVGERFIAVHGKKRPTRERMVPIVASWQRTLLTFALRYAKGTARLFLHTDGLRMALRRACMKLGRKHLCPNDLRRTFNVWMQRDGIPTELRASAMGHASTRLLDSFTYGKLAPADLHSRMLNTLADRRTVVTDGGGRGRTEPDKRSASTSKEAPRAGIEPATHGLTVRWQAWLYHSMTRYAQVRSVNRVSL